MKTLFKVALAAALVTAQAWGLDTSKLKPMGYVNDFAHVIDGRSAEALEAYAGNVERATGVQMAIVTIPSLEGDVIENVSNKLYKQWGIGKQNGPDKDEGILLLLAIEDHKTRAEVGYGLEPIITDGQAGDILRSMRQVLRQGNYGGALEAAATQIGSIIAQAKGVSLEAPAVPLRRAQRGPAIPFWLIIVGFLVLMWLLNRGGGGSGTGFLTGMILGNMMGRGGRGGWGGGGFGGYDGGGGGGGFGGFGGGSSGGGGASSDW